MDGASRRSIIPVLLACAVSLAAAQNKSETHQFTVSPGATVTIINDYGPITVRSAAGNQVSVTTISDSSKVQVAASPDTAQNRVELRSHHLRPGDDQVE